MDKEFREYEWDNRLGKIKYDIEQQQRSLKGFRKLFKKDLKSDDITQLCWIENHLEEQARKIGIIERRYYD